MLLPLYRRNILPNRHRRLLGITILCIAFFVLYSCFTSSNQVLVSKGPPRALDIFGVRLLFWPYSFPSVFRIPPDIPSRHAIIPEIAAAHTPRRSDQRCDKFGPRLLLGVFSTAERRSRRDLIRKYEKFQTIERNVEFKFVIGASSADLDAEQREFGDLMILQQAENMNAGKTYAFLQEVAQMGGPRPQFVAKADDDTIVHVANLLKSLENVDCNDLVYFGKCPEASCGQGISYSTYFVGLAYGLSWPVVELLGSTKLSEDQYTGHEDALMGNFIASINTSRTGESMVYVNWRKLAGNYNDFWIMKNKHTIALHIMKTDEMYRQQAETLLGFP